MSIVVEFLEFIKRLEQVKIFYWLKKSKDRMVVDAVVLGEKWQFNFIENKLVEIVKFISTGEIFDQEQLKIILPHYSVEKSCLNELIELLVELEDRKIQFRLDKIRDSILVEIDIPNEKWEVEFMDYGTIEIEKHISDGKMYDVGQVEDFFCRFSD